jgi:membrane-associated protease RseP (regulator of RpoE activity)
LAEVALLFALQEWGHFALAVLKGSSVFVAVVVAAQLSANAVLAVPPAARAQSLCAAVIIMVFQAVGVLLISLSLNHDAASTTVSEVNDYAEHQATMDA